MKGIIPTQKEGIRYLEHCKIHVLNERLVFAKKEDALEKHFSIPYFNLSVILLGEGTSITQKAARFLSSEGVMIGFVGSDGTPLFLASQDEYRETKYCQKWFQLYNDKEKKIDAAIYMQKIRTDLIFAYWNKMFNEKYKDELEPLIQRFLTNINKDKREQTILTEEAVFSKKLYSILKKEYNIDFKREHKNANDKFNKFLNQGNYLAYGLAATTLWTLGIPHSLPLVHGQTRKGALVFDLADIIKDAFVMSTAFEMASNNENATDYREKQIDVFDENKVFKTLFKTIKDIIEK